MPQNARINQTDVTADYANTVLWEAGEEGSDYGAVTTGIQEDLYSPSGGLRMDGTWVNSFQLIAKVGEEANASDITQGAGFIAGAGQYIDVRVPNGEFKNIRIEGTFLRIIGTSTNTKLTNCVGRGMIQPSIADDLVLDNTLFLSDGIADSISIRDTAASLNKSTVISLNDTGGHVLRSRGSAVVDSNDSVCFAPNTATSFLAFIGGTFTGNYNAGHTGGSTPGANSITNLTRTVGDVFTDPTNNDYTPKVGGPLDGASSTGGFIGAFAPAGGGVTVTALLNSNYMVEYSMKKNVASQSIGAQMVTISDGSDFTGTVTAEVTIDNGTKTAGGGSVTHEGEGYHSYAPTQAETNGDHIAVSFAGTGALTQTIQVYTTFPQTVDNDTKISLIPTTAMRGTDSANTVVPPSVAQFNARTIASADYFDPAADTVANVTLVATTTTNTDMVGTNNALLAASYTAPDNASITSILADTNELQLNQGDWLTATGFSTLVATDIVTGGAITTLAGLASVNILKVNGVTIIGAGTAGDLWRA